ncbi:MAG: cobyric acid synthase, partial [Dehalococcoidia bacterium]|nr:cobyric acid synthase [Dehalococcoidia bacterium]
MVQGTGSGVGKSLLAAALCRILYEDGLRVAPFKGQNMSLNSFVTREGGEMGRAQVVQAQAAGVEPQVAMNPVLIKPEQDARSQVVVLGRPWKTLNAADYYRHTPALWDTVARCLDSLMCSYDVVVIEGAGSPAEINLRRFEIVNMRVAAHAQAPVLLVGDIDKGGVFASLFGTLKLLEPGERCLVKGLIINKFRGDISILKPGVN